MGVVGPLVGIVLLSGVGYGAYCVFTLRSLAVTLLALVAAWRLARQWYWRLGEPLRRCEIQGPEPSFLLGNLMEFKNGANIVDMVDKFQKVYGKIFSFHFGVRPALFVMDLDALRDLLSKKFYAFSNRTGMDAFDHEPWQETLLCLKDDQWRHVRSQLSPSFSTGKLKKVVPTVGRVVSNLNMSLQRFTDKEEAVELKLLCGNFTMDTIAGVAFGVETNCLEDPDNDFSKHGLDLLYKNQAVVGLFSWPWLFKAVMYVGLKVPYPPATRFFRALFDAAVKERRNNENTQKYNDFLQLLVEAEREGAAGVVDKDIDHSAHLSTGQRWKNKGLTENEMVGNALLFFLAGYDTVSTTMSFVLFCLAANPHCLEKAQQEIDSFFAEDDEITYEKVNQLTYLDMCISETLRMFPPGFLLTRRCDEDVELSGGVRVPAGCDVMVSVVNIHRDPEIWPDPETFDPERFTTENKASRHPFAYLAWGMGPRNCIGMRLAQLELRLALASTLRSFSPVLCEKSVYPPKLVIIQRIEAKDGLWVKFQRRERL